MVRFHVRYQYVYGIIAAVYGILYLFGLFYLDNDWPLAENHQMVTSLITIGIIFTLSIQYEDRIVWVYSSMAILVVALFQTVPFFADFIEEAVKCKKFTQTDYDNIKTCESKYGTSAIAIIMACAKIDNYESPASRLCPGVGTSYALVTALNFFYVLIHAVAAGYTLFLVYHAYQHLSVLDPLIKARKDITDKITAVATAAHISALYKTSSSTSRPADIPSSASLLAAMTDLRTELKKNDSELARIRHAR